MDIDRRKQELKNLDLFINSRQKLLSTILDSLGWTEDSLNNEVKIQCPINSEHWIPESAISHHKEVCQWVQSGYEKEELDKLPPDSAFFYEKSQNVIPVVLDRSTQVKILSENGLLNEDEAACMDFPRTADRWTVQLTPKQKLAIYDYVVNASKTVERPKNVTLEDLMIDFEKKEEQDEKPKSQLEILAEMRDYKRRRQSYRAKNVHITKKSYTEIMKEVIENQTNYLVETIKSDGCENSRKADDDHSNDKKRRYNYDVGDHSDSEDTSKFRDRHGDYESGSRRHRHSHHESSKHSPKRKKHKKDRSRSRSKSPSRHKHKKSHKHKRSRD